MLFQTEIGFVQFLQALKLCPDQLAQWVVIGEKLQDSSWKFPNVLNSLLTGLYGSCLLPEDTDCMLKFLQELARLQIAKNENPRK